MSGGWLRRWYPAFLVMAVIFAFSSRPSDELLDFGAWDYWIKKGGHAVEYGVLSLSLWRGFRMQPGRKWLAWGLAVLYAATDELHQAFVPGRYPSAVDVLLFDNVGAFLALVLWDRSDGSRDRPV